MRAPQSGHRPDERWRAAELAGVLALANGSAWEVTATSGELPAAAAGLGPPPAKTQTSTASIPGGLIGALALAFLGGLILNLMPCVFPVLSMKAASLAGHAHHESKARAQGLAFLAGVLATFLALAGLLLAVRAGGAAGSADWRCGRRGLWLTVLQQLRCLLRARLGLSLALRVAREVRADEGEPPA